LSSEVCRQWRGPLAVRALGLADPAHAVGLDAHLDGCADCRSELDDLTAVADAVALADPERLGEVPVAPPLADRIVAEVSREAAYDRRKARRRLVLAVAAVLAVLALLATSLMAVSGNGDDGGTEPIRLAGGPGIAGTAELTSQAWGTEVALEVSGLEDGAVYWLWLSDEDGERSTAGTFSGTSGPTSFYLASALPLRDARRIWMTDEDDEVVLDAFLE
jgi:hypothetical protein